MALLPFFHGFTHTLRSGFFTLSWVFGEVVQKEINLMNSEVTTGYILAAVFIAAGITFLLRLPFGLKKALAGSNYWMRSATGFRSARSHYLPSMRWRRLITPRSLRQRRTCGPGGDRGVHLWRKNMVLSMVAGTVTCVVLANWVF